MGKGGLSKRRWVNDRIRAKRLRDKRQAEARGEARKAEPAAS